MLSPKILKTIGAATQTVEAAEFIETLTNVEDTADTVERLAEAA